jgi:hypothetical protein
MLFPHIKIIFVSHFSLVEQLTSTIDSMIYR